MTQLKTAASATATAAMPKSKGTLTPKPKSKGMLTPTQTINRFYKAIMDKNAECITQFYVPDEKTYVVLEGPRLATLGFSKIKKGWNDFCNSPLTLESIEWQGEMHEETDGNMAWLAGIIKLTVGLKEHTFTRVFRSSFVMRRTAGNWRIRHEHVSASMDDPYGIGDWLK